MLNLSKFSLKKFKPNSNINIKSLKSFKKPILINFSPKNNLCSSRMSLCKNTNINLKEQFDSKVSQMEYLKVIEEIRMQGEFSKIKQDYIQNHIVLRECYVDIHRENLLLGRTKNYPIPFGNSFYRNIKKGKSSQDSEMKRKIGKHNSEHINNQDNNNEEKKDNSVDDEEPKLKNKTKDKFQKENTDKKPNLFSKITGKFKEVWQLTFPPEANTELIMEKRKQEALLLKSKIKEASDEEIIAIESAIPEWKRGAVVLLETDPSLNKPNLSFFEIARANIRNHITGLNIYKETQKSYENSELNLLMDDLKVSFKNVKENVKESQNPFFAVTRDIADRVTVYSPNGKAVLIMRKYDPDFDIIEFEKVATYVFAKLLSASIKDDLSLVRKLSAETASAMLTSEIKTRRERVNNK